MLVLIAPLRLTDGLATVMTALMAMGTVFILTPPLIRKMHAGGMVGLDVNKRTKQPIAELGGIAALFAFSLSLSLVIGFQKLLGNVAEPPFLAAIGVFFMAATIGLIDDISDLPQRLKAVAVAFAALPLMLVHVGPTVISLPFGLQLAFLGDWRLLYWLILVPIGVTGVANATNMSAGYNGLETGQIAIASLGLIVVAQLRGAPDVSLLVFGAIFGCAAAMYYFNRYPARVFLGDIGTLGLGAALAAGVILAHIEFYGVIAIAPAFFELAATAYYGARGENGRRREACRNPIIDEDGVLHAPKQARHYTLAYWILSRRPSTEKALVQGLLAFYAVAAAVAVLLALV
jgi:UDP-N-acetylglucosamine--dolichyl-phosphate N-acetylglucosaminephosphotransferase